MNRILILGIDGYIGWTLANHLLSFPDKYEGCGLDNLSRRKRVRSIGSSSLIPIAEPGDRFEYLREHKQFFDQVCKCDLHDAYIINRILHEYKPNTIVHLAEQPSAPYSMKDVNASIESQVENLRGTLALLWAMKDNCPDAHLLKLGTMGDCMVLQTALIRASFSSVPAFLIPSATKYTLVYPRGLKYVAGSSFYIFT